MPPRKVVYSGVCLCGHRADQHHCCCVVVPEIARLIGDVVPDACCYYGSNEMEGRDAGGRAHCFGYVDRDDPDPAVRAAWRGTTL